MSIYIYLNLLHLSFLIQFPVNIETHNYLNYQTYKIVSVPIHLTPIQKIILKTCIPIKYSNRYSKNKIIVLILEQWHSRVIFCCILFFFLCVIHNIKLKNVIIINEVT
jgi:hypothetical protein